MRLRTLPTAAVGVAAVSAVAVLALTRDVWLSRLSPGRPAAAKGEEADEGHDHDHADRVHLSPEAMANLGVVAEAVRPRTYWRTVQVPGIVADRPGQSDRGVIAPVAAVVTRVAALPGDTVRPGDPLFTLRIVSESLLNSQSELFKNVREVELNQQTRQRYAAAAQGGAVPEGRLLELDNQERRLRTTVQTLRQELITRGLTPAQIDESAAGRFVTEVTVAAPRRAAGGPLVADAGATPAAGEELAYEVQELKVQPGEQVQAGQLLGLLANHRALYIEGRGFKQEADLLARAAERGWELRAEFAEDAGGDWPPVEGPLTIHHLANTVDPVSRTFPFYVPLANQSRTYTRDGRTYLVWRFRPGQRVRLRVPVERLDGVFVVPATAVVREGPEAYVFRRNGDLFERRPVHVLLEDGNDVVLADGGGIASGLHIARSGAAALNRALKAQAAGGEDGDHDHDHDHHHHHHEH